MALSWHWLWAAPVAAVSALAIIAAVVFLSSKRDSDLSDEARAFSLEDDLSTESSSGMLRMWRVMSRIAVCALTAALILAIVLVSRPSKVDEGEERSASRDIVLCLDVSGSTLPYDREVIDTYRKLVSSFKGERIGLSIFNSTSRTVFPLTDDYELVADQLETASGILEGVETQDDIDAMEDADYQKISDWLEGTQNRKDATSLIGDGVVSCAAMLPGFTYSDGVSKSPRAASIVLATDNVVSGDPTYTLQEALDLTGQAGITVDGLFSGPRQSESDSATNEFRSAVESHGGVFLTQSNGSSVAELVKEIESRRNHENTATNKASLVDAPGWWTLALAAAVIVWMALAWRLRR